jgi:antitoxin (DNA-binding transcriptional repressor) of toxin-antitoxin stability system
MSKTVNMLEAKTHLSRFVQQLRDGQEREVIIAVAGTPHARLIAYDAPQKRRLGMDSGLVTISDDFDDDDEGLAADFNDGD